MKKHNLFILSGVIAAVLIVGSANAAPGYHGATNTYRPHTVTHVQSNPRAGHHHVHHHSASAPVVVHEQHHHHHHHNNTAGNIILATALLISAFM